MDWVVNFLKKHWTRGTLAAVHWKRFSFDAACVAVGSEVGAISQQAPANRRRIRGMQSAWEFVVFYAHMRDMQEQTPACNSSRGAVNSKHVICMRVCWIGYAQQHVFHTCIHTYIHYVRTYITCIHTYMHTYITYIHAHINLYIHTSHLHTYITYIHT